MAISGSGTQNSPYLVSTIAEIIEAFGECRDQETAGTYYVKLANDIDGDWAEWSSDIDFHSDTDRLIDFDLDGHSIKNFMLASRIGCMAKDTFRNGKIYNLYSDRMTNYILSRIKFVDMSLSAFIGDCKSTLFDGCEYSRTALWLRIKESNAQSGYSNHPILTFNDYSISDTDGPYQFNESDVKVVVDNVNTAKFCIFEANGPSSPIIGEKCRIQGEIKAITPGSITEYPAIMSSDVASENSVINFSMPAYSGTVTSGEATTIIGVGTTGIINSDLISEETYADYTMLNLIPVTDEEMHSAIDLTAKGFEVYDIN